MQRKASAHWQGGLKEGNGTVSTESGVLQDSDYSFSTRFENGKGTNPEELIAAAHAGCFSMALSAELEKSGLHPESIRTEATVSLDKGENGFSITAVHLDVVGKVPKASPGMFEEIAERAKTNCPVSRALSVAITFQAKLEG